MKSRRLRYSPASRVSVFVLRPNPRRSLTLSYCSNSAFRSSCFLFFCFSLRSFSLYIIKMISRAHANGPP